MHKLFVSGKPNRWNVSIHEHRNSGSSRSMDVNVVCEAIWVFSEVQKKIKATAPNLIESTRDKGVMEVGKTVSITQRALSAPSIIEDGRLHPIQDLMCGAVAGMTARMLVAPLDVLKIRFQVQSETHGLYKYSSMTMAVRSIISEEGVRALWKGNIPALLMVTPYAAIQLATFYQIKQSQLVTTAEPYRSLSIGAVSAATATICTYPLDLLRTRFAAQKDSGRRKGLQHAIRRIYDAKGIRGFYAGLQPTLVEIVPYISLHFAFYEGIKSRYLNNREVHLKPHESMVIGACSGTTSKFLTLPLDNAKKLMQVQGQFDSGYVHSSSERYRGVGHVLQSLWRRYGFRGLFRGAAPSLVKAAPNSAITFAVYESAKRYISS